MIRHLRALSLIELLVSVAICTLIVASVWTAFVQVRHTVLRAKAATAMHREAAAIHKIFADPLSTCFHGAQVRLSVTNPGTATAKLVLDIMQSSDGYDRLRYRADSDTSVHQSVASGPSMNDLRWQRFTYLATDPDLQRPCLYRAVAPTQFLVFGSPSYKAIDITTSYWQDSMTPQVPLWAASPPGQTEVYDLDIPTGAPTKTGNTNRLVLASEVRRDRRRAMIDNDLRLWANIPNSTWTNWTNTTWANKQSGTWGNATRLPVSDDEQLDLPERRVRLSDSISRFRLEWVDAQGMRTTCDPSSTTGITYTYGKQTTVTPPTAVALSTYAGVNPWTVNLRVLDGLWTDGRNDPCPLFAASSYPTSRQPAPADERPVLLRVAFVLTDRRSAALDPDHPLTREFSFTFPLSSLSVAPPRTP
jgi:hypothetical protein